MNNYKEEVLVHMGVKGMKWGHRKTKEYVSSYTKGYREASNRQAIKAEKYRRKAKVKEAKYRDKANKADAKRKEYDKVAKKSLEIDKKISDRRSKQKAGSKIASLLLNSQDGNRSYDTLRVLGVSRGKAIISSFFNPMDSGLNARNKYVKS